MSWKRQKTDSVPAVEKLYRSNQEDYASCGGFEADDDADEERRADLSRKRKERLAQSAEKPERCEDCGKELALSWLWDTYGLAVCDACRDPKGKHKVISRTEAKKRFALRDEDLDHRRPVLRFLSKKNPHNPRYGDMKLYLLSQVEERACSLHGSVANIELLKEERREKREQTANKRFENRIKAIRKQATIHEHEFGPEQQGASADSFWQECVSCGYKNEYEKL